MSLHDRIMALPVFNTGAEVTRLQAANRAKEADELMAEMGNAIASVDPDQLTTWQQDRFSSALIKYNAWKELTK